MTDSTTNERNVGVRDGPPLGRADSVGAMSVARIGRLAATVAVVLLAWIAGGCGDDDPGGGGDASPNDLSITTGDRSEYQFEVADSVEAGAVRLDVDNAGQEPHHAQVFRLNDDADVTDLETALATGEPPAALEVGTFLGGTGLVSPGESSRADAVVDLQPGNHVLLCFIPDPAGTPHVAHGMLQPFEVTDSGEPAPPPVADVEVVLVDYRFDIPSQVDGQAMLSVTNAAPAEAHEMVMAAVDEDVGVADVVRALDEGEPFPGTGLGGMQALVPGGRGSLALDLAPGRYVLFCAVTSPDGTPHYRAGMATEVDVT